MKPAKRIAVVGANAAGLAAASRAKRRDPAAEIVVLEAGSVPSVSNCNFAYVLSGRLDDPARVVAHPPEYFSNGRGLDLRLQSPVVEVQPARRLLRVAPQAAAPYELSYDRLVYTAGALARRLEIPGRDAGGVFALHSYDDLVEAHLYLQERRPRRIAVVGCGFKGLGLACALAQRCEVALVCAADNPLGLAPAVAARLNRHLEERGITVRRGVRVNGYLHGRDGRLVAVETDAGRLGAEAALELVGVIPNLAPLGDRLDTDRSSGALVVDARQETSVDGVFAAGDCATVRHALRSGRFHLPNGAYANRAGRTAGANAAGGAEKTPPVLGTRATELHGLELSRTGLDPAQAAAAGYDAALVEIRVLPHATFHKPLTYLDCAAVVERPTGRLLGVQLAGEYGANHRINAAATAIHAGLGVGEAACLDYAYHPAASPVWDPLLVLFRAAEKELALG